MDLALVERIEEWDWIRIGATIALPIVYYAAYVNCAPPVIAVSSIVLLLYLVVFWIEARDWSPAWMICFPVFIIAVTLAVHYRYAAPVGDLLGPLVGVMAMLRNKMWPDVFAILALVALLVSSYPGPWPVDSLAGLVGLFLWVRNRRLRQDAQHLSELHLRELEEAHAALQAATIDSMRYAAMEERVRLAHEIHDGLGHQLTSLIVQLQALEIMLPDNAHKASETTAQLLDIARTAMSEVRTAVKGWSDDETGIGIIALKSLVAQMEAHSATKTQFEQESELSAWSVDTSMALYRVLQESLTNVMRHADAKEVTVHLKEVDDHVILTVMDDGRYSDQEPLTPGFGLQGIAERCRSQGGTFTFGGIKPHGLRIEVSLPLA